MGGNTCNCCMQREGEIWSALEVGLGYSIVVILRTTMAREF